MTSYREIDRLRKQTDQFRALAKGLLALEGLTEWEQIFCESISARTRVEEFTTLQGEKLLQIRDDHTLVKTIAGFSVAGLAERCYHARLDLPESDEEWLIALWSEPHHALKRRDAGRLLRCAQYLNIVEIA